MPRRRIISLLLACPLLVPAAAQAANAEVGFKFTEYVPADATIKVGEKVTWAPIGTDSFANHPLAAAPGQGLDGFGKSSGAGPYDFTFTKPGRYVFYCTSHGSSRGTGMAGTVTVTDEAGNVPVENPPASTMPAPPAPGSAPSAGATSPSAGATGPSAGATGPSAGATGPSPGATGPSPAATPAPPPAATTARTLTRVEVSFGRLPARSRLLAAGLPVRVRADAAGRATAVLRVGRRVIARSTGVRLEADRVRTVRLRFTTAGRRYVRARRGRLIARVSVTVTPTAAGDARVGSRRVRVR